MSVPKLSTRERDVLELLAAGLSQEQMAAELDMHASSISQVLVRIRAALGAVSSPHAVALGYVRGVLGRAA